MLIAWLGTGLAGCQLTLVGDRADEDRTATERATSRESRYFAAPVAVRPDAPPSPSGPSGDDVPEPSDAGSEGRSGVPDASGHKGDAAAPSEPPPATPWILIGELVNARDVGGTMAGEAHVAYRALYRGPPLRLSPGGCNEFRRLGIRTVIDLRIDSERQGLLESPCVGAAAGLTAAPLPVPYNVSPQDYVAILDARESIAAVFDVLADASRYPAYVHCTYGRDRTGVVIALVLSALGVSREEILREYLMSRESVGAFPLSLEAALDEIERRGGIEAYLASVGVTAAQLAQLRLRALAR
jgi:protein-tyrosine phosphatase